MDSEAGDEGFGAQLIEHGPVLRRFAATLIAAGEVEDLVQDTYARAWVKRDLFDPDLGTMQGWLLAILADQARTRWRRRSPITTARLPDMAQAEPSSASLDLRRAVDALPPRQRTAVVLRHYVDLPIEQIATLMGCSPGTVKSTLHDARRSLSTRLGVSYVRD